MTSRVMAISPLAGKPVTPSMLVNVPSLITAYYADSPDPSVPAQRVSFGTSGHRGSSFDTAFNEHHIVAISQAICLYRAQQSIDGPLFLGMDTHALSVPARASALEVLAANGVHVLIAEGDDYTPTPVISHAILTYNRERTTGVADGIVITPSHNPPRDGGYKYNPPHGGPAELGITSWIEAKANEFLERGLQGVKRIPFAQALRTSTTHRHDYLGAYTRDLGNVVDMEVIRGAGLRLGVDPLGGAGVHYWGRIAERYGLNLTVVNDAVDPTFRFMTVDWDGQIRMDPSSPYAMRSLVAQKDRFDIAFACDTDHDRHGIVTRSAGLLPPNHYLSVAILHLFRHRPRWRTDAAVGKTVVSSQMIDRVTAELGRQLYEVPVGFKWFVEGLLGGTLAFAGEESAGASFARLDGTAWTTDKDGIVAALLSAEITARAGRDPGEIYRELTRELGAPVYDRIEAPATPEQQERLKRLSPAQIRRTDLAGEGIQTILTKAPGNGAPIGGVKVIAKSGWFAARPSGTESIYKIYAESFRGADHLRRILEDAQAIVDDALAAMPGSESSRGSSVGNVTSKHALVTNAQPKPSAGRRMTAADEVVFLLDVDNTLLDNDRIVADLDDHLRREFGDESRDRYWTIFEAMRDELGYADYLGALQRYRLGDLNDPRLLLMSSFLVDYPFADRLYDGALDVIEHLRVWGPTVILSDGDVVFQPRKTQRSGLWGAVEGRVLIYLHKELMLDDVECRYPARHYVMVDDKLRILTAMKKTWGDRLTTVFPRQGHYACDPENSAKYPPADLTVEHIGDLVTCDISTLLGVPDAAGVE